MRVRLLRDINVFSMSLCYSTITETQRYCPAPVITTSSTDIAIQRMPLYLCLCLPMNSFVSFSTDGISSGFKSPPKCAELHICNPELPSVRKWKLSKTWRLEMIGPPSRVTFLKASFISPILVSVTLPEPEPGVESTPVLRPPPFPASAAVPGTFPGSVLAPFAAPPAVPVPLPAPSAISETDCGSLASESHAGSLVMSVYCQAQVSGKPWPRRILVLQYRGSRKWRPAPPSIQGQSSLGIFSSVPTYSGTYLKGT